MTRMFSKASILAGAALGTLCCADTSFAEPTIQDLAARTELRVVQSLTISDEQFLTGDKSGTQVALAGQLRLPQRATGRLPVVIQLHGSGGLNGGNEFWGKYFNEMGVASFMVDSFSERGITGTSTNQALLGRLNMILDAYRAFDVMAAHPRIDPTKIAVMGSSRGGQSALYSSMRRFQEMWNPRAKFAVHIPLYASCATTFIGDTDVTAPIRQFHGAADDYVTVAPCRPYFERLRAAGHDAVLTEYEGAHHTYDNPLNSRTPTVSKGSQSTRACTLKEVTPGKIINVATGQVFTYKDPCVEVDPHAGYHEAAANATRTAVRDLLRATFKLN
jgi:dienelactone hydrolase